MITNDKAKCSYFAGMLDAEGCVALSRTVLKTSAGNDYFGYDLKIGIANTSTKLMNWLVENFGGQFRAKHVSKWQTKTCYEWFCNGGHEKIEKVLLSVLPYMVIKREQAGVALQFIRLQGKVNPERRAELHAKMISLNSGKTPTTNTSSTQTPKSE